MWHLAGLALAIPFVAAVRAHFDEPLRIADAVDRIGLPRRMSGGAVGSETAIAVALMMQPALGGVLLAAYMALLLITFGVALLRRVDVNDCACSRRAHRPNLTWYVRNLVLGAAGVALFALGPSPGEVWTLGVLMIALAAMVGWWFDRSLRQAEVRSRMVEAGSQAL